MRPTFSLARAAYWRGKQQREEVTLKKIAIHSFKKVLKVLVVALLYYVATCCAHGRWR